MQRSFFMITALALYTCVPARTEAALVFYLTRADFNTANPGLPTETFSAANVAAGSFASVAPPIDATTNDGVFSPGGILPGLTISTSLDTLVVLGDGNVTGTTKAVGAGRFTSSTILLFGPGAAAVGTDVFAAPAPGPTIAETFEIDINGASGLLGTTTVSETAGNIAFFGVSSDVPITSITLHDQGNNAATFVDNISFDAVPEPGSLALGTLTACAILAWRVRSHTRGKPVQAQVAE